MVSLFKTKRILFAAALLTFLAVGILGSFAMIGMNHNEMSAMSGCPFAVGETALCEMNILAHIASWQTMFASLPPQVSVFVLLLLAVVLSWARLRYLFGSPNNFQRQLRFLHSSETYAFSFSSLLLGSAISPRAP